MIITEIIFKIKLSIPTITAPSHTQLIFTFIYFEEENDKRSKSNDKGNELMSIRNML